ncbi:phosphotransferase [Kribbella sp. NPDC051770]|uniref:phosphotransferase family protein n=1 Tax=Kribbella sp. NPDC051770 TaxID=3155413 RepID=UPI00342CE333
MRTARALLAEREGVYGVLPEWIEAVEPAVLKATGAPAPGDLGGEQLRRWGSSEVWRLSYGLRSVIVKRGSDTQSTEGTAYERYVRPLRLPAPELIELVHLDGAVLLVMEDVGRVTLEQEPSLEGFLAAVDLLAEIRSVPVDGASEFDADRLSDLAARVAEGRPEPASGLVERVENRLRPAVADLHRMVRPRVVHGDYVGKNLVTDGRRWTPVDWPLTYLAPQLPDLYTLTREAVALGHDRDHLVTRYCEAAGTDRTLVERQTLIGGCGFTLRALAWVIEEGVHTVPSSKDWITPLLDELDGLLDQLP